MLIAGMSDLHGKLSHSVPECDVLAIVGDIVPLYSSAENWQSQREFDWAEKVLLRWLRRQRARRIIVVPGNHDIFMWDPMTRVEARRMLESDDRVMVMDERNNWQNIDGLVWAAHPWTPTIQNRNWAFSQQRSSDAARYAAATIPEDTDILLTHGPPQGFLDSEGGQGRRLGCAHLMHRMIEVGPRLTLCGHIHEERGRRARWFDRYGRENRIGNVSICDVNYSERGAKVQTFEVLLPKDRINSPAQEVPAGGGVDTSRE